MLARYQLPLLLSSAGVIGDPSASTGPHSVGHAIAAAPSAVCSSGLFPRALSFGFKFEHVDRRRSWRDLVNF